MVTSDNLETLEIKLLLEAIYQRFGDDFRGYQVEVISERLFGFMQSHGIATVSALQNLVLHEVDCIDVLLCALDAREPVLFDPPYSFLKLREHVVPWLRSCPAPKIWIADCAAAEDVFSLVILLAEENLRSKTRIYVTSRNLGILEQVRAGRFPLSQLSLYQENYGLSGGTGSLATYFRQVDDDAVFHPELSERITWAQYDLATDASFNEFEAIICAGGLAQYTLSLRRRALQIFSDSLPVFGVLALLGPNTVRPAEAAAQFEVLSARRGLYLKARWWR